MTEISVVQGVSALGIHTKGREDFLKCAVTSQSRIHSHLLPRLKRKMTLTVSSKGASSEAIFH